MKNIVLILFVLTVAFQANAQKKYQYDTLNGNETVNFPSDVGYISVTGDYSALSIDIDLTEIGGTSDGTLILQGRNQYNGTTDGSWSTLTSADFGSWINYLTNDTLTITDGAVWKVEIHDPGFNQYRIQGAGTASDSTLVELHWQFKK